MPGKPRSEEGVYVNGGCLIDDGVVYRLVLLMWPICLVCLSVSINNDGLVDVVRLSNYPNIFPS
jgi:hypothetical protein